MARTDTGGRRAGGAPIGEAQAVIESIIDARTRSVTVTRPSKSTGSLDETTETTSDHTEQLWLVSPSEYISEVETGERTTGDLRALGTDGIDVQHGDRITYGGVEYEVDTVVGRPDDNPADGTNHSGIEYFDITLIRRQ